MRRIIFLDFDGVLVNQNSLDGYWGKENRADPACVKALNRIVQETGAHIVVSSAWRHGTSVNELREILTDWGVIGHIVGKTPSPDEWFVPRGEEIKTWLRTARPVKKFVILDDDLNLDDLGAVHIKTNLAIGLTEAQADQAIAILQEDEEK